MSARPFPWQCFPTHVLWRIIWHPCDEGDLVARARTTRCFVLHIEDGVSATNAQRSVGPTLALALRADKLFAELAVVWVAASLLNDNLLPVVGDLKDDPLCALAEL